MRGLRAGGPRLTFALLLAAGAATGCSLLIGVSGDPVVVDEDSGDAQVEATVEGGDEVDSSIALDAASADETDAGDAGDGAPE